MREINQQNSTGMPDLVQMLLEIVHSGVRFGPKVGQNDQIKTFECVSHPSVFYITAITRLHTDNALL